MTSHYVVYMQDCVCSWIVRRTILQSEQTLNKTKMQENKKPMLLS